MNTNTTKDTSNKDEKHNPTDVKNVDQKPCFTTSAALIFTNLHNAAVEQAARKIGVTAGSKSINQFIINSGMSDDGRTISDSNDRMNPKFRFNNNSKSGQFEVGIVLEVNATNLMLTDDERKTEEARKKNEKAIENAKNLIIEGLKAYMKTFSGSDNIGDPVEFIPDYNGGKVQVLDGQILGIDDYTEIIGMYNGTATSRQLKKNIDPSKKLRIGYKVGYTIFYNK